LLNRLERLSHRSLKKWPMHNAAAFMLPLESVLFRSSEAPSAALSFRVSFSSIQVALGTKHEELRHAPIADCAVLTRVMACSRP
jgi:hypothetical protein